MFAVGYLMGRMIKLYWLMMNPIKLFWIQNGAVFSFNHSRDKHCKKKVQWLDLAFRLWPPLTFTGVGLLYQHQWSLKEAPSWENNKLKIMHSLFSREEYPPPPSMKILDMERVNFFPKTDPAEIDSSYWSIFAIHAPTRLNENTQLREKPHY